jgi:cardiolipin synthase A/B
MTDIGIGTVVTTLLTLYALGIGAFLIAENRAPQATLAWLLAFLLAPGLGVLIYFLFGRDGKAFSKQRKLLKQDLTETALPVLSQILSRQDAEIARLERDNPNRNRVEIQQNATVFYASMIKDMEAARHSIHLQYFIWSADAFTERLKAILMAKARAGVEVRLLYDPLGSRAHLSRTYVSSLQSAGIRIAPTSPLYQLHTISYRNHRKITVIDGTIGYTGGMNVGQEHLDGGRGFDSWRDTQLRVVGDGAAVLQAVFMIDWYNAVKEDLFSDVYYPVHATELSDGDVPVQILTSGPDSRWAAIRQLYVFMIGAAQSHVYIQSPFFIPDATIAEALKTAALADIDVRVMLSARPSGNRLPHWAGTTYVADIAASGVRVFLYDKGYLHAKTISVDGRVCSIGSANIDIRSFSINYELNAVLYSERLAEELENDFRHDLAFCTEFDPAADRKRPAAARFRDSAARLLSPLL